MCKGETLSTCAKTVLLVGGSGWGRVWRRSKEEGGCKDRALVVKVCFVARVLVGDTLRKKWREKRAHISSCCRECGGEWGKVGIVGAKLCQQVQTS